MAQREINIFVSYAQDGPDWAIEKTIAILNQLKNHRNFKSRINFWTDRDLIAGNNYNPDILSNLEKADIIILLIENNFFQSSYISNTERPIIEEHNNNGGTVIPIFIDATSFYREWVSKLEVKTLPGGPENTIFKARNREELWRFVRDGLEDSITNEVKNKYHVSFGNENRNENRNENEGCFLKSIIGIVLIILGSFYLFFFNEKPKKNIEDISTTIDIDFEKPIIKSPKPNVKYPTDKPPKTKKPNIPDIRTYEYDNLEIKSFGYFGKESYGIYESCQGRNKEGYKPCKLNRNWYIVNERLNVHHKIGWNVSTHKDIYAIRPFYNGVGEVYFYDNRKMYLSFCVNLNDQTVDCYLRNENIASLILDGSTSVAYR